MYRLSRRDSVDVRSRSPLADGVGASWYKAAFRITPHADEPWTLAADCDGATAFEFTPLRRRADPEGPWGGISK